MSYDKQVWLEIHKAAAVYPPRTFLQYHKHHLPHPREAGARLSAGVPRGQSADYRFPPDHQCRGLHVQEFTDRWEVHVDEVHPACDFVEHVRVDAPKVWVASGAVLGSIAGILLGRSKAAAAAGAGLGALIAGATCGGGKRAQLSEPSHDDQQGSPPGRWIRPKQ